MEIEHPNPYRQNLLTRIVCLANKYPHLRILQLIGNAVPTADAERLNNDLYYVTDEQMIEWLDDYEKRFAAMPRTSPS